MSELQLSDELISQLQQTLTQFDARANDPGVAVQYYAAVVGCMIGQQQSTYEEKKTYLKQLLGFVEQVFDDVAEPPQEAFGVWKPGDE